MTPDFSIKANGEDITSLIRDRLISLKITDKPGLDSDECELTIDDRDGVVAFPDTGARLSVSLGYVEQGLSPIGSYQVDEVELSGPPQTLVIKCKAADMKGDMKTARRGGWEDVKLEQVVKDIAARHKLQPVCQVDVEVPRADQVNESDLHFLTRLARQHNATATIKEGKLLVLPRGGGKSASGKELPAVALARADIKHFQATVSDRPAHGGVEVEHHNSKTGKKQKLRVLSPDAPAGAPVAKVRHTAGTAAQAKAAAGSRLAALNRATKTVKLQLAGRADLVAEKHMAITGIKEGVDGTYLIESVEHTYSSSGWETSVDLTIGNDGDKAKGKKKDKNKKLRVLMP